MIVAAPRRRLPNRRNSVVYKLRLGGHKLFIAIGEFSDGTPAEVWIDSSKDGTTLRGFMGDFARLVSIALQSGVPLSALSHSFRNIEYPPCGDVEGHATIQRATSVPDLVLQVMESHGSHPTPEPLSAVPEPIGFRPPPRPASYDGDPCTACGAHLVVRTGTCKTCQGCGHNDGCS